MYILFTTAKSASGIFAIAVLLYTIVLAFVCPKLKKQKKTAAVVILCVLPVLAALVNTVIFGTLAFFKFFYLYVLMLIPLINILPGKKRFPVFLKSFVSSLTAIIVCFLFLVDFVGASVHNYSRMSYTQSFKKMLDTMKKEYCLNSWKKIDYDVLLKEYLPKVEEAERNNDESAYAAVISEVTYRFFDFHVYPELKGVIDENVMNINMGNDYGLSMVKLDDGKVIAVLVEPEKGFAYEKPCDLNKFGIHDGTQIIAWDGQEINGAISKTECISYMMQFSVKENEDFYRPAFLAGKGGESVEVTFIDDSGNEKHAELKKLGEYSRRLPYFFMCALNLSNREPNFSTRMIDDKCGYLLVRSEHFDSFTDNVAVLKKGYYPELTEFYAKKIQELKDQGMKYLVIDIRSNMGGYDNVAGALVSLFTDEKKHMFSFGYEDEKGYHITENHYIYPDGRFKDLPVVVLTNARCGSAGDGMAKFLGECDNVTLMGLTASAGVNQNDGGCIYLTKNITVNYPVCLTLSMENVPLIDTDHTRENRIPLDVKIPMTKEFALRLFAFESTDTDAELEYAVKYIENR